MTQEYVTVQAPQATSSRRPPSPARRRRVIAVGLASGAAVWAGLGIASMWPNPMPEPVTLPTVTAAVPEAARSTAHVYQEWINRVELVECLAERGFAYEPRIVDHHDRLELTAQYLGVEPATATPHAPLPMLRQPDLYLGRGAQAPLRGSPACTVPTATIDTNDAQAVQATLEQARADGAFLATVAEQVWTQRHPAEVTHQVSLLRHDRQRLSEGQAGSHEWSEPLAVVTAAVQDGTIWVPVTAADYNEFAQSVGLVASGGAVAVRLSGGEMLLDSGTYMTRSDVIRCGPITMSAGVKGPWGTEEDLREVMQAMATGCNALIVAGLVEAETLAEVYWD